MTGRQRGLQFAERSASFIGSASLAGRLIERGAAFAQILLIAAFFGSSIRADLYFIASIVPLTIGTVVGEASYAAVLPRAASLDTAGAKRLIAAGFWVAAGALVAATAAYVAVAAVVVPRTEPAGSASLLPWLAFAPVAACLGLATYASAALLHFERYLWPAFRLATAAVVGLASSAIALAAGGGVVWVGACVTVGYAVALCLLLGELVSIGHADVLARPSGTTVREALRLWRKAAAAAWSILVGGQVVVLLERALAAPLGVGSAAAISYARGAAFTPTIIGQSVAVGVYPSMLRARAAGAADFLRGRFESGLRLTSFIAVVSGAFIALLSEQIADMLFEWGALDASSLDNVAATLAAFSLAVAAVMLTILGARVLNALDMFAALALQQALSLCVYLAVAIPLRAAEGTVGLAFAAGIAETVGAVVATTLIVRRIGMAATRAAGAALSGIGRAAPVVLALALARFATVDLLAAPPVLAVAVSTAVGAAVTAGALWLARWPELDSLKRAARRGLAAGAGR